MTLVLSLLLFAGAFLFSGLDAAWLSLNRIRLRHRADKGDRCARQMLAAEAVRPQADLVLAWTGRAMGAGSFLLLLARFGAGSTGAASWVIPLVFLPVYALLVQVVARQVFRRLPFMVLSRFWWLVALAGSFWAPLARPLALLLRRVPEDPLPRLPAAEELMNLAGETEEISPLEQSMLRSVMEFRRFTARDLALPADAFSRVAADRTLGELLSDRASSDASHTLVMGADGLPLGAIECGAAALSGALSARAQSFARPLLVFPAGLPAWKALVRLRRSPTPVAEVRDEETGVFVGIITEATAVARLFGREV